MGGHSWSIISTALVALLTVTMCDVTAQGFNNHFSGVPEGVAGVDYPNLTTIPRRTGFTCRDRKPGFYADPVTRCQAWHWCDTFLVKHTFLCPNLTVFNQRIRGCDWWYNVDCSLATSLYSNNDELYRDKDDDDYDETAGTNTNHLGSTKRPFINVEVHTTPRPIQHTVSPPPPNNLFNGAFGTSESIHSRVAVAGNSLRNDDVTTPFPVQDLDFQSTPEPFGNQFLQIKTIPPPFHSTPPPTAPSTTTPPTPTNNNRVIILAPTRHPSGFNFNIPNAIPIAFPTARPSSRFGPDPPPTAAPTTTTTTPIPPTDFHQPIQPQPIIPSQPFDSQKVAAPADVKPTPGEFARADNGLTQGINLRRRLVSRVRGQKQLRQNGNGFAVNGNLKPSPAIITTAASPTVNTPQQQQPQLSSHVHFIAGDPNFNVAPPPTTDSNFAIEPTTFQDDGNRFFNTFPNNPATQQSNDFTDLPFTPTQNDELAVTTTHQQDFFTTENEFTPPQQAEDVTLQQQPVTKPPVRSPKLVLLREPIQQQQPQFISHTLSPQQNTPPPPPPPPPTSFFNAGIPYGARLRPVTTTSSDSNSLDNSGVFRRHDVFTSAAQNNATKVAAVSTSPTTVVVTTSNASFRKRKFLNGSNNSSTSKINTFPPFPVTTFSPKNGETFESTKQLKQEQAGSKRRKVPTAATVWFKIFPSSSTAAPTTTTTITTTTTTTTTEAPPSTTTTTTTEVPRKSVPNKKSTTAITKKRRTFPSFPITTFKPRVHLTHTKTQSDGDFGERDEVTSSTTTQADDTADTSTWSQLSTTSAQ